MIEIKLFVRRAALAVAIALPCAVSLAAASQRPSGPTAVEVVIPDRFPSTEAFALVVRFAAPGKTDLVLLDARHATPQTLGAALALLRHLRATSPRPGHDVVTTVRGFATVRASAPRTAALEGVLRILNAQPTSRVGNLGTGRWVELPDATVAP